MFQELYCYLIVEFAEWKYINIRMFSGHRCMTSLINSKVQRVSFEPPSCTKLLLRLAIRWWSSENGKVQNLYTPVNSKLPTYDWSRYFKIYMYMNYNLSVTCSLWCNKNYLHIPPEISAVIINIKGLITPPNYTCVLISVWY